jgi:hypothetical protein
MQIMTAFESNLPHRRSDWHGTRTARLRAAQQAQRNLINRGSASDGGGGFHPRGTLRTGFRFAGRLVLGAFSSCADAAVSHAITANQLKRT